MAKAANEGREEPRSEGGAAVRKAKPHVGRALGK